jgi:hypothetical protein
MDVLINVVLPVFAIILTGYLAGRFEALGPDSAAALNRFAFYFALPTALFVITARAPIDKIFNWPFIGGALLTLLIALIVGRFWFHHRDVATLSMVGLTAGWTQCDHIFRWKLHRRFGGHTRFKRIAPSCGLAFGSYAFAQPVGDLAAPRHSFFDDRIPAS